MSAQETGFIIQYQHQDCRVRPDVEWEEEWSCARNSECPECGVKDIEPVSWEEV
jgi:hypothetical protein